ncbi:MAG: hypothetical protein JWO53_1238, partial [Chlamydiia bacterium]|nr:hypothetical protein [Chlamydiia bacterium]
DAKAQRLAPRYIVWDFLIFFTTDITEDTERGENGNMVTL